LIYVGEGSGGCTGDYGFFEELSQNFEKVDSLSIPRWSFINDYVEIFKKC
jgi:hypothetical protein